MNDAAIDSTPRAWPTWLSWSLLLTLAVVLYELRAQSMLSVAVACSKFGWNDFLTARWLRRSDPDSARGRTLAWLHIAFGLWKITGGAFLGSLIIVAPTMPWGQLLGFRGPPRAPVDSETMIGLSLTVAGGLALAMIATWIGLVRAWRERRPLWLGLGTHRARRKNFWPPSPFNAPPRRNHFHWLQELTLSLTGVIFVMLAVVVCGLLMPAGSLVASLLLLLGLYALPTLQDRVQTWFDPFVAATPDDCWPTPDQS